MNILRKFTANKLIIKKSFLGGIWKIRYDSPRYCTEISFFGFRFCTIHYSYGVSHVRLLRFFHFRSLKLTVKMLLPTLIEYVQQQKGSTAFDMLVWFNRSGETMLTAYHLEEYMDGNGIYNPVFVSVFPNLADVLRMFYPDIEFVHVPHIFFELHFCNIAKHDIISKRHRYFELLTRSHLLYTESFLQREKSHYYEELKKHIQTQEKLIVLPRISASVQNAADAKMNRIALKEDFVFIAPAAQSNSTLPPSFWAELAKLLHEQGYDVLLNSVLPDMHQSYYKWVSLKMDEARYVVGKAAAVVGIRSGFLDVVAPAAKQTHAIYLPFGERGRGLPPMAAYKVMMGFSLSKLPGVDQSRLYEYNAEEIGGKIILHQILERVTGKNGINTMIRDTVDKTFLEA